MKITTWNKLWSRPEKEQQRILAAAKSIHPNGRSQAYREKNRRKFHSSASLKSA